MYLGFREWIYDKIIREWFNVYDGVRLHMDNLQMSKTYCVCIRDVDSLQLDKHYLRSLAEKMRVWGVLCSDIIAEPACIVELKKTIDNR